MKRYLVFKGEDYYPVGGWDDFNGAFDTLEEAKAAAALSIGYTWSHIVDTQTMEIVDET